MNRYTVSSNRTMPMDLTLEYWITNYESWLTTIMVVNAVKARLPNELARVSTISQVESMSVSMKIEFVLFAPLAAAGYLPKTQINLTSNIEKRLKYKYVSNIILMVNRDW